jgi:hypothetical protein
MSSTAVEWIIVLVAVLLFAAAVGAEILWLSKQGWASTGKAALFVLLTDLVSFGIGSFLVFVLTLVAFMLVMGPAGRGGSSSDGVYVAIVIAGSLIPPLIFFFFKRIMLGALSIRTGRSAWLYSLAVSLLFLVVVIIPPPALFYIVGSVWK